MLESCMLNKLSNSQSVEFQLKSELRDLIAILLLRNSIVLVVFAGHMQAFRMLAIA